MKPLSVVLYQDNTQALEMTGLQDILTGGWLNTASVSATLLDENGKQVTGCIAITLVYQIGTDGNYTGIVGPGFQADIGGGYTLVVDADQSPAHLHLEIPTEVRARTS